METVELRFTYTQDEYVRAERQYLIANKTIRRYDLFLVMAFLLFAIGCLFIFSFSTWSIIFLGIVLVVTAMGSFLYFCLPIIKFKRTSKYHQEYIMIFTNDSIKWKTLNIESHLNWNIYSDLWESADFYFLLQAPRVYTLIPKRAFVNQEAKQAFESIALSNLKSIKHIN